MPSTEAQRTLVKSPPELWAEFSDPASLARHLGEFGEIRIVRVEPEKSVEWEAPEATGAIQLEALRLGHPGHAHRRPGGPRAGSGAGGCPRARARTASDPEPAPKQEASSAPDPLAEEGPEPRPATRRSRLFARLFRRRRAPAPELEQPSAVEVEPAQPEPEPEAQEPPPTSRPNSPRSWRG